MTDGCNGNVRTIERRAFLLKCGRRLGCLALVALLGCGALRGYGGWRKQHLAKQTAAFVAKGDFKSAVLVARRLLDLDPANLAACRAMAEIAEKTRSAEAINWRRKIVYAEPTPANQLALARCAVAFGQRELAEAVLNALPESAHGSVNYHQIAGAEALARKDMATAEKHFAAATALAPNDNRLAFNLAALRLTSTDAQTADEARQALVRLTEDQSVRLDVLRALTGDALVHRDRTAATKWSALLKSEPNAAVTDALLYYQAVEGSDAAAPALAALEAKAATSANAAAELITWMNRHGMAQTASAWSASLPRQIRETHPVPLAIAESFSFLEDWTSLRSFVEGQNWGPVESLRLAVQAHALRRLSGEDRDSMQSETIWRSALKAAQTHPEQLVALAQLAEGWGYQAEAEEAWWQVANGSDNARAALGALQHLYRSKQNTRGLLRVAKRALELNPDDLLAANSCANLGLLVSNDSTARRLALKLHHEHPDDRAFAATYAYALHTEGKRAEALKVLEKLKEEELRNPAIAAYYVVMLTDDGKLERARSFLGDAQRATLLPEEQRLLEAAVRTLLHGEASKGVAQN